MFDELRALSAFARVVEAGSFSRAAAQLGVTKSAISKHVANLETELHARLLVRTTRKLALTDAGERVYRSALRILGEVEALQEAAQAESAVLRGHLRITAPAVLGQRYLTPVLTKFLELHPGISVEVMLSDTLIDLVAERIDLAFRIGRPGSSTLIAKKLASIPLLLAASPAYLARRGTPKSASDLAEHEFVMHGKSDPSKLRLSRSGRVSTVTTHGRLTMSDGQGSVAAALEGYGIVVVPAVEVANEVRSGALVMLLPGYALEAMTLSVVYPMGSRVPTRARALLDHVEKHFRAAPWRL